MKLVEERRPWKENSVSMYMVLPFDNAAFVPELISIACSRLDYDNIECARLYNIALITTRKYWDDSKKLYERLQEEAKKYDKAMYSLSIIDVDETVTSSDVISSIQEGVVDVSSSKDDNSKRHPFDIIIWDDLKSIGVQDEKNISSNIINNYHTLFNICETMNVSAVTSYKLGARVDTDDTYVIGLVDNIYHNIPE